MSFEATWTHWPVVAAFSAEEESGAEAAEVGDAEVLGLGVPDVPDVDEYALPLVQSVPMTTVTSE